MSLIVIMGGGPAGLALAAGLSRSAANDITVIEKSTYDNFVTGEHLQAGILPILDELKIPKEILTENSTPCDGIFGNWAGRPVQSESIFNPYGHDYIVHRPHFDNALARHVRKNGVKLRLGTPCGKIEDGRIFAGDEALSFDYLFDCSGRTSRAFDNRRLVFDNLLGVSSFFLSESKADAAVMIESAENGWWYYTHNKNTRIATFFTDADIYKQLQGDLQRELEKTTEIKKYCGDLNGTRRVNPAYTSILKEVPEKIYQVGDALFSLDPLSSQGIYKAFKQASKIADFFQNGRFEESVPDFYTEQKEEFFTHLRLRKRFYSEGLAHYGSEFYKRRDIPEL